MTKSSELDCYLYFMWNCWSEEICIKLFGKVMGKHYWSKWSLMYKKYTAYGASGPFYAELDESARAVIRNHAYAHYNH